MDESFEKNYEVQRGKREKRKYKEGKVHTNLKHQTLKFQIVFPHSKSISSKLEAMRGMSVLLEYLADHRLSSSFHVS